MTDGRDKGNGGGENGGSGPPGKEGGDATGADANARDTVRSDTGASDAGARDAGESDAEGGGGDASVSDNPDTDDPDNDGPDTGGPDGEGPDTEGPGDDKPRYRWPIVAAVVLTAILEILDTTIVNVALPHMKAAFGITNDQTVWILTSYIVAAIVVMPLTGFFSRRLGRRRLITSAIIGFTTFSALCGLSWSITFIVICRIGQGLCGAFLIPMAQTILFDSFPRSKRGQAMAMFGMGVVVAPIFGPTLGAILTDYFSWRAVFYVNVPVATFALVLMSGELEREETRWIPVDWVGLALMVCAFGSLEFMLDLGQNHDWFSSPLILGAAYVAVSAGFLFVLRGWGLESNIVDFSLLRDRSFAASLVAMMGFGTGMFGTLAILPLFVQGLLGYPVLEAGYLFMPRGLTAGLSMILTGSVLMKRVDPRVLVGVGLGLTGTGNMMLSGLNLHVSFWEVAIPGMVGGFGIGLFFVPLSTLAFQNISSERQDEASGIYGVTRSLGSSTGIAVLGWQISSRVQVHRAALSAHVTPFNQAVQGYLAPLGLNPTSHQGAGVLARELGRQASMMAFQDAFMIAGVVAFAMLPLLFLLEKPKFDGSGKAQIAA